MSLEEYNSFARSTTSAQVGEQIACPIASAESEQSEVPD
jgi:hypothetical protein